MSARPVINTFAVTNTKLAACLWVLGFEWEGEMVQNVQRGKTVITFLFRPGSKRTRYAKLELGKMLNEHKDNKLDVMHPLEVMMRAQHNYDALMDMIKQGKKMRLCSVAGGQMYVYREGPENATLVHAEARVQTQDQELAAALAGAGLPVVGIDQPPLMRGFTLPRKAYPMRDAQGTVKVWDAEELMKLSPTEKDPRRLLLELSDPDHVVVLGFDALHARTVLRQRIRERCPLLLAEQSSGPGQALFTPNAQGRVMAHVERHLKAPPMDWKK